MPKPKRTQAARKDAPVPPKVSELILAYMKHAETYYVDRAGHPTSSQAELRRALSTITTAPAWPPNLGRVN